MATVDGTAGNDFIHMAGDRLVVPEGYNQVLGITSAADRMVPAAGADSV